MLYKDFDRYLGGQPSPQSTNYAKIIVVHCAFLSKNYEEILVLKSHNFMIEGMVVPQDTVRVLNSYVVVPQYWTMYDSLKQGGIPMGYHYPYTDTKPVSMGKYPYSYTYPPLSEHMYPYSHTHGVTMGMISWVFPKINIPIWLENDPSSVPQEKILAIYPTLY